MAIPQGNRDPFRRATGPGGKTFWAVPGEAQEIRRRMPRTLHLKLASLAAESKVDEQRLNDLLILVARFAEPLPPVA